MDIFIAVLNKISQEARSLMNAVLRLTAFVLIFSMIACSSPHKKIRTLNLGLTKYQVLKELGEPHEKYRKNGQDHWVYLSTHKAKQKKQGKILYQTTLSFEEGVLISNRFKRSFTKTEVSEFINEDL